MKRELNNQYNFTLKCINIYVRIQFIQKIEMINYLFGNLKNNLIWNYIYIYNENVKIFFI